MSTKIKCPCCGEFIELEIMPRKEKRKINVSEEDRKRRSDNMRSIRQKSGKVEKVKADSFPF